MKFPGKIALLVFLALWALVGALCSCDAGDDDDDADEDDQGDNHDDDAPGTRQIDWATLQDKIRGSWVGQMAGVTWGASTEFKYTGRIIPEGEVPQWTPDMINSGFIQDDIYVEIPFIETMRAYGVNVGWGVFGDAFRDTRFPLAHANLAARNNLRGGIPAPFSGHYQYNEHCDDIDWQIEADFVGMMCPGMVNPAVEIAWRAGHVMNYGDGVLGGVFIAAMHAASFFAGDLAEIIEAGVLALPEGSKYRFAIEDVLLWHGQGRTWEEAWQLLQDKWGTQDRCPIFEEMNLEDHNIDAKLNGTYVLIGLLYGNGDFENSMRIAMRCGQDSDCNPSSVGAVLGNWIGFARIPDKFKSELQSDRKFLFTTTSLDELISSHLELTRQVMLRAGATVEGAGEGEVWTIPGEGEPRPPILEKWPTAWNARPVLRAQVISLNGRTVEFFATASDADGILDYQWHFGDLERASSEHAVHEYLLPGTYEVICYVADWIGNTSWQALSVTVP